MIFDGLQDVTKNDMEDEKQSAEAEFFEYVSKAYRCFLAGDDDQCEEVVNAKAAEFDERASEIRDHNRLLQDVRPAPSNSGHHLCLGFLWSQKRLVP